MKNSGNGKFLTGVKTVALILWLLVMGFAGKAFTAQKPEPGPA